ncbi:MAG: NmrA family NAD(P)-binding protein [Pricia sp.]
MKKILITGATGNVGKAVVKSLIHFNGEYEILAGTRHPGKSDADFLSTEVQPVYFNFEDIDSTADSLETIDILFLLRPPRLANVKKYFAPLIHAAVEKKVGHIVFLSVQGAEKNSFIPHHNIEKLILESGLSYTFLRPAYFMQNFTTTLRKTLVEKDRIYLPAGNAKFTMVDVNDVGKVGAHILANAKNHHNTAYELTNDERLTFGEMAKILSAGLDRKITYESPNLLSFFIAEKKEGTDAMFILVMIMLHYLPRFQSTPPISDCIEKITGERPTDFSEFVKTHATKLTSTV